MYSIMVNLYIHLKLCKATNNDEFMLFFSQFASFLPKSFATSFRSFCFFLISALCLVFSFMLFYVILGLVTMSNCLFSTACFVLSCLASSLDLGTEARLSLVTSLFLYIAAKIQNVWWKNSFKEDSKDIIDCIVLPLEDF